MATEKTRGAGRTRSWTFLIYPESAPKNWRSVLDELHIQWVESPLHDQDINDTGERKKPHYHILLAFDSVKAFDQVEEITKSLNSPIPQKCNSVRGMVRYMAHLDNPEKVQYSTSDIIPHGGFDVVEALKITATEKHVIIAEMMDFVDDNDVREYYQLLQYARKNQPEWFSVLCDSASYVMGNYIKSYRHHRSL